MDEIQLKNGKKKYALKSDDRYMFFDNIVAMSRLQFFLMLFIVIIVILISIIQIGFMGDALNKIYEEVQLINYKLDNNISYIPFNSSINFKDGVTI